MIRAPYEKPASAPRAEAAARDGCSNIAQEQESIVQELALA
jgi:hypothetical protein